MGCMLLYKQSSAYKLGDGALRESCVCMVSSVSCVSCVRMPMAAGLVYSCPALYVLPLAARKLPLSSWVISSGSHGAANALVQSATYSMARARYRAGILDGHTVLSPGHYRMLTYTHACRFD